MLMLTYVCIKLIRWRRLELFFVHVVVLLPASVIAVFVIQYDSAFSYVQRCFPGVVSSTSFQVHLRGSFTVWLTPCSYSYPNCSAHSGDPAKVAGWLAG